MAPPIVHVNRQKNSFKETPKYVVPARRQGMGKFTVKITPTDKVEPRFRTPSEYLMIGSIKIPIHF